MINIQINDPYKGQVDPGIMVRAAEAVFKHLSTSTQVELSIVVDGDEQIQHLNRSFLGIDSPTDVLSFPADEIDPDSGNHYIGDIIISLPRARAQAAQDPLAAELQLLVVHGVLHLLGFDHTDLAEKTAMWQKQKEILDSLGVRLSRWPED